MKHARPTTRMTMLLSLLLLTLGGGCMSTRVTRVARFEPSGAGTAVHRPAPRSAAYKVKYAGATGRGLQSVGGTKRIVRRGESLGFTLSDDGAVVAIAGGETIPLPRLPPTARYCVWTCNEKRPTQFSREVGKAALTAIAVPVVGAAVVGMAYLDQHEEECDEDESPNTRKGMWKDRHDRNDAWDAAHDRRLPGDP